MVSSSRIAILACPNSLSSLVLSLLHCFIASLLPLFPPAGWRGARRWFASRSSPNESSAAVLVLWLMAAPPATRSGPPAGGLAGVPERRPCSNRLPEILRTRNFVPLRCERSKLHPRNCSVGATAAVLVCAALSRSLSAQDHPGRHRHCFPLRFRPGTRCASRRRRRSSSRRSAPS